MEIIINENTFSVNKSFDFLFLRKFFVITD